MNARSCPVLPPPTTGLISNPLNQPTPFSPEHPSSPIYIEKCFFDRLLRLLSLALNSFCHYDFLHSLRLFRHLIKHLARHSPVSQLSSLTPRIYFNLGIIRAYHGEHFAAAAMFEKAKREDPGLVIAWYALGLSQFEMREWKKAGRAFRIAGKVMDGMGLSNTKEEVVEWRSKKKNEEELVWQTVTWELKRNKVRWNEKLAGIWSVFEKERENEWQAGLWLKYEKGNEIVPGKPFRETYGVNGIPAGILLGLTTEIRGYLRDELGMVDDKNGEDKREDVKKKVGGEPDGAALVQVQGLSFSDEDPLDIDGYISNKDAKSLNVADFPAPLNIKRSLRTREERRRDARKAERPGLGSEKPRRYNGSAFLNERDNGEWERPSIQGAPSKKSLYMFYQKVAVDLKVELINEPSTPESDVAILIESMESGFADGQIASIHKEGKYVGDSYEPQGGDDYEYQSATSRGSNYIKPTREGHIKDEADLFFVMQPTSATYQGMLNLKHNTNSSFDLSKNRNRALKFDKDNYNMATSIHPIYRQAISSSSPNFYQDQHTHIAPHVILNHGTTADSFPFARKGTWKPRKSHSTANARGIFLDLYFTVEIYDFEAYHEAP